MIIKFRVCHNPDSSLLEYDDWIYICLKRSPHWLKHENLLQLHQLVIDLTLVYFFIRL